MNVTVMSRENAIKYCHKPHQNEVVIISISDPNTMYSSRPFISGQNGVKSILPLSFVDSDRAGIDDAYGHKITENDLIQEKDAVSIHKFVDRHKDCDIIVHCDAGVSRSAGVAAAILKATTGSDNQIFKNMRYRPNMRCYRTVLNEFMQ